MKLLFYLLFLATDGKNMIAKLLSLISFASLISSSSLAEATLDPSKLIKYTPENNAKCVEYYNYQGELYCSTTALNTQPVDPHIKDLEKLKIMFDDRPWQAAWGKQTPLITTIEYIPFGANIDQWHELITSQFFPGLQQKMTPTQLAHLIINRSNDLGLNLIVTFIEESPQRVIFEFRVEKPENQKQDELQMITTNSKGLYVLHYVIKESDMGKVNREKWIQNLKNTKIK
jgi:hypothetical protein